MSATAMLDAALGYAAQGFSVMPLDPVTRKPVIPWKALQNAPASVEQVRAWWQSFPTAGVGIITGAVSGLVVVDLDGPAGLDAMTALGLNALDGGSGPWIAKTRRGWHLYFQHPGVPVANRAGIMREVDVRADGGFAVAPPSPGYSWVTPPDRMSLAPVPPVLLKILAHVGANGHGRNSYGPVVVPEVIPEGTRDTALFRLGRSLVAQGASPEEVRAALLAVNRTRCVPPLPEAEVLRKVEHVVEQPNTPEFDEPRMDGTMAEGYAKSLKARRERAASTEAKLGPVLVRLADVAPQSIEWLWPGRIPRAKLMVLSGDPGLGKSVLTLDVAARVTTGASWPDGGAPPVGDVVLLSAEDNVADTIRPRFDVLGGNPARLHVLQAIRDKSGNRTVDLSKDIGRIEEALTATSALFVVIDPVDAYLGAQTDSHKNASVRRVLAPLSALAERTGATILMVMHLSKTEDRKAVYRTLGSIGFVGAARVGLVVDLHPDDKNRPVDETSRRVLATTKSNVSAEAPKLAYRVVSACPQCRTVGLGPVCGACGRTSVGLLLWSDEAVRPMTTDELLGARTGGAGETGSQGPREDARRFLTEAIADGEEVEAAGLFKVAAENGISKKTLIRAKAELGIHARMVDRGTPRQRWFWSRGLLMTDEEARRYAAARRAGQP